jgi:hypothetical protein
VTVYKAAIAGRASLGAMPTALRGHGLRPRHSTRLRLSAQGAFYEILTVCKVRLPIRRVCPIFYPSISRWIGVAQVGCFEAVWTALSGDEHEAHGTLERIRTTQATVGFCTSAYCSLKKRTSLLIWSNLTCCRLHLMVQPTDPTVGNGSHDHRARLSTTQ